MSLSNDTGYGLEAQGTRLLYPAVVILLLADAMQRPLAGHPFIGLVASTCEPGRNGLNS
jgi:hypothetical protein